MKIQKIKSLEGFGQLGTGTCIECGRDSFLDDNIVRIQVGSLHTASFCLCPKCLNRLSSNLDLFIECCMKI
jgi:hypothetical protein